MELIPVEVPKFISPHLFWIIDIKKRSDYGEIIEKHLDQCIDKQEEQVYIANVGEVVAVERNNKYFRASVQNIVGQGDVLKYICWLIDAGIIYETKEVMPIPAQVANIPSLATQACLNGVVFVEEVLSYRHEKIIRKPTLESNEVVRYDCRKILAKSKRLQFKSERDVKDILLGDLFYECDGEWLSLSKILVDAGKLMVDKNLFNKFVKEEISEIRNNHFHYLYTDQKHQSVLNKNSKSSTEASIEDLAAKMDFCDVVDEDSIKNIRPQRNKETKTELDTTCNPKSPEMLKKDDSDVSSSSLTRGQKALLQLQNMRKQKKAMTQGSASKDDSINDSIKTDSSSEIPGKPKNKREELSRLRKKYYQKVGKNVTDDELNTSITTDNTSSDNFNPNDGKQRTSRLSISSNELSQNDRDKTDKDVSKTSDTEGFSFDMLRNPKGKKPIPKCVSFTPGGACHTLKPKRTSDDSNAESKDKNFKGGNKKTERNKHASVNIEEKNSTETTSKDSYQCGNRRNLNTDGSTDESPNLRRSVQEKSSENTEEESKCEAAPKASFSLSEEDVKPHQLQIKPKCSCPQCDHFTHDGDYKRKEFVRKVPEPVLRQYKSPPLLDSAEDENKKKWKIIAANSNLHKSKIEQQASYKLLVHGPTMINPIKKISDANLHESVYKTMLPLGYSESTRIQSFGWPSIFRNQNVCLVNNRKTGKTITYVTALASELANRAQAYSDFSKSGGPLAVILCKNSAKCEETFDLFRRILGPVNCKNLKVYLATYPVRHLNTSNVDVLITLPTVLLHLLMMNATNFKRLCHFVIDDADVLLKKWQTNVHKIFNVIEQMLTHRAVVRAVQIIICSMHWNKYVEKCIRKLYAQPMICIGNAFEAAMYGRVDFVIRFLSSACKEMELKQILKDTYAIYKSVLICNNEELEDVETMLSLRGINALVIYDSMNKEEILAMESLWNRFNGGEYKVLVCTDHVLHTYLTVSDVVTLIHYSLPATWSAFTKRFTVFNDSIESPFVDKNMKYLSKSYILTDESCATELTRFLHYLKETEIVFPPILQGYYEDIVWKSEQDKIEKRVPFCTYFCVFGEKCKNFKCTFRHTVDTNLDAKHSTSLPVKGQIQLKIVEIVDVTHFQAQIISHTDPSSKTVKKFDDCESISDDLTQLMEKEQPLPIGSIGVNQLYAYKDQESGKFSRCICISLNSNDGAEIRFLDGPRRFITSKKQLYDLPDEFKILPYFLVDVYLSDLIPPFGDDTFSTRTFKHLETLLKGHDYKNAVFNADIALSLYNTLWLKNVALLGSIDNLVLQKFNLCTKLKEEKLAEVGEQSMKNLYEACRKADIELPNFEEQNEKVSKSLNGCEQAKPRWAFLDEGRVNEVIFSSAISPDEFYVRIKKFDNLLTKLSREIEEAIRKPNYHCRFAPTIGKIYAIRDSNDDYSRVQILDIKDEKALCVFVDYGDEIVVNFKDFIYLSNHFIEKLPFQAIKCSLHGIKPVIDKGWCDTATKILYDYGFQPETDIYRNLFAKVVSKKEKADSGQNYYDILLKDSFGERQVLLNELIVECGLGDLIDDELKDFQLPEIKKIEYDSSSDDEENRMLDIYRKNPPENTTNIENINADQQEDEKENEYFDEETNFYVDNFEDFEFCIKDPSTFLKELMGNEENKNLPQIKESGEKPKNEVADVKEKPVEKNDEPVNMSQDFFNPTVRWSQTDDYIKINIILPDCLEYKANVSMRRNFCFKTTINGKLYQLTLILFDIVDNVQHTAFGSHIRVSLKKIKPAEWPRLTLKKARYSNIHYDISAMKDEDEERKKILQLPKELDEPIEDDDSEIDMMYVVESDMDSDYDHEMIDTDD